MTNAELEAKAKELRELQRLIEEATVEADALKDEIKCELNERKLDCLTAGEYRITWKEIKSNRLDTKALKAAMPEVFQEFTRVSTTRRFTIN